MHDWAYITAYCKLGFLAKAQWRKEESEIDLLCDLCSSASFRASD
jgi:hypothetical protein